MNKADNSCYTPLHWAAQSGYTEIVKLLLAAGADVNQADNNGRTSLHRAKENGREDIAALLIEKGAELPSSHIWKPRLKKIGIGGLAYIALLGSAVAGYKYFTSKSAEKTETPDDEIGAMDANADFIPGEADSSLLLPDSDLVPVH